MPKSNYSDSEIGCVKQYSEEKVEMVKPKGEKYSANNVADYKKMLKK